MKNPIMGLIEQTLLLLGRLLPKDVQPIVAWVAELVGGLDFPEQDPRVGKVAALVEQLLIDIRNLSDITDTTAREKARLILENRFGRAWIESGLSSGGA